MNVERNAYQLGRRAFLAGGTLVLASPWTKDAKAAAAVNESSLRVGLVTDLHFADKPAAGTRHYRETLSKLDEAARQFEQDGLDFLVELGDLIDAADAVELEQGYLKTVNEPFSKICSDRHYVLGNHCVDMLTKEEFLGGVRQPESYYSFDRAGFHFVVLDACFRSDGKPYGRKNSQWHDANIPASELDWLQADLQATDKPVVVFAHQRLDVNTQHGVKNNAAVRSVLEASAKVLAVFQGHSHQNDLKELEGIHYCTLVAMVEGSGLDNNGYSIMDIDPDGTIRLKGFRKQRHYDWAGRQLVH